MNLLACELDEGLDRPGFGHRAASVGDRIGGTRIGAAVYEAEAGRPTWPYHYHYGAEEWQYVLTGTSVLRDPAGERALSAGDLVCFSANHLGAHTSADPSSDELSAEGFPRASVAWPGATVPQRGAQSAATRAGSPQQAPGFC
jgi:uncharacterized cupin superfamily protein